MTKNNFKIGDEVEILIDDKQDTPTGIKKCSKGTIGRVCHIMDDYIMVEIPDDEHETALLDFNFDEVKIINESKIKQD